MAMSNKGRRESTISDGRGSFSRRLLLKSIPASTTIGLAGCLSGGGGGGNGSNSADFTPGDPSSGTWPDLSGRTLTFLSGEVNPELRKFYNRVNKDFESATGAKVEMTYGGGTSIDQTLIQQLQAGNPPELYTSGPDYIYDMILQDQAAPVTDVYNDWVNKWGEPTSPKHHLNYKGEEWLIPWDIHGSAFHYREDVWKVGPNTSGSYPRTWDKWLQAAKEVDSSNLQGCYTGAGASWCPQAILIGLGYSNDAKIGSWNNGNPQIVADKYRNKWIETLNWVKELHSVSPPAADAECADYVDAYIGESVSGTQYSGGRPKTSAVNEGMPWAGEARIMPLPYKSRKVVQGKPEGVMTFKNADPAGKEYLRFLGASEKSSTYLNLFYDAAFGHVMPPFPKYFDGPWKKLAKSKLGENKWHQEDIDALRTILFETEWRNTSNQTSLRQYHGPVWNSYALAQAQHNILINNADPASEFDKAVSEMKDVLKEAKQSSN